MHTHLNAAAQRAFWVRVRTDAPDACWWFTGDHTPFGYGQMWHRWTNRGHAQVAHRIAWILTYGPIPEGLFVCHRCDHPGCVNPAHLFLGTHRDNMADMVAKGRSLTGDRNVARRFPERMVRGDRHPNRLRPERMARGERHGLSTLRAHQVREIRARARKATTGANSHPDCYSALAREFGVNVATIHNLITRKTWKQLPPVPDDLRDALGAITEHLRSQSAG